MAVVADRCWHRKVDAHHTYLDLGDETLGRISIRREDRNRVALVMDVRVAQRLLERLRTNDLHDVEDPRRHARFEGEFSEPNVNRRGALQLAVGVVQQFAVFARHQAYEFLPCSSQQMGTLNAEHSSVLRDKLVSGVKREGTGAGADRTSDFPAPPHRKIDGMSFINPWAEKKK
jgi:hypothetical protein